MPFVIDPDSDDFGRQVGEVMEKLANYGNGTDQKAFVTRCLESHRTLQQTIARIFGLFFIELAERPSDLRNEAAVELAGKLKPILKDSYLPFI